MCLAVNLPTRLAAADGACIVEETKLAYRKEKEEEIYWDSVVSHLKPDRVLLHLLRDRKSVV